MKLALFVSLFILTVQCTSPPPPAKPQEDASSDLPVATDTIEVVTISADTRAYATQLLEEKAKVSDDGPIEACLDSLYSKDPAVRNFYWKVLRVILRDSDGALSETLGARLLALMQSNPMEFAAQYDLCEATIRAKCTSFMAYEKFMNETPENAVDEVFRTLKSDCKNCQTAQLETLDDICREIKKGIRWYRNNE